MLRCANARLAAAIRMVLPTRPIEGVRADVRVLLVACALRSQACARTRAESRGIAQPPPPPQPPPARVCRDAPITTGLGPELNMAAPSVGVVPRARARGRGNRPWSGGASRAGRPPQLRAGAAPQQAAALRRGQDARSVGAHPPPLHSRPAFARALGERFPVDADAASHSGQRMEAFRRDGGGGGGGERSVTLPRTRICAGGARSVSLGPDGSGRWPPAPQGRRCHADARQSPHRRRNEPNGVTFALRIKYDVYPIP